jgi:signal transduction histidine kinase
MTGQPIRRPLRARLALTYAVGVYAAGVVVLVLVDVPLAGVRAAKPKGSPDAAAITSGPGITLPQLLAGSAIAVAVLVPVALALGWAVAGRFLSPLRAITATAQSISAGDLHRRLDLGAPADELTELGHTLDALFARLQAAFDAHRHFVANASHELRTPLAGLRTLLEVTLADPDADAETLREACREALALGAHQERLVRALLVLATSERGISCRDTCDLAAIARAALASRADRAADQAIEITERLAPALISGDPKLIESLISNLVDNAVRHNRPGGHVSIVTEASESHAGVTVANTGPVVPRDELERLRQPFQRLAPHRHDGYGLGLAIIDAVAQAHHAALTVTALPEGGLSVAVRFARAPGARRDPG